MNGALFLRYYLELVILLPAAALALIPVRSAFRLREKTAYMLAALVALGLAAGGALLCTQLALSSKVVLPFCFLAGLILYDRLAELETDKKLFCFFNAAMVCVFCRMYTHFLAAPLELQSSGGPFSWQSSLLCLGLAVLCIGLAFRTLHVKIPLLLHTESLNLSWRGLLFLPLTFTVLLYWMTPVSFQVVMTGRVRTVSMVLLLFVPCVAWILYHFLWLITARVTQSARLQQENTLLQMEHKRYDELRSYMDASRALRHDFRQHLLVIGQYAKDRNTKDLQAYLEPMMEKADSTPPRYCMNTAADAIAAHYARLAEQQQTRIAFKLELPEKLPLPESDYCALLGNLLENALRAVAQLPEEDRRVEAVSLMLSDAMLGVSVSNPYTGKIRLGKNGLPHGGKAGHGLGLASVASTVQRYRGTLDIRTENNVFAVDILMYCGEENT